MTRTPKVIIIVSALIAVIGIGVGLGYYAGFRAGQISLPPHSAFTASPGKTTLDISVHGTKHEDREVTTETAVSAADTTAPTGTRTAFSADIPTAQEIEFIELSDPSTTTPEQEIDGPLTLASILKASMSIKDPHKRRRFLKDVTSELDIEEIEGALVDMEALGAGPMKNEAAYALVHRMAQLNPLSAMEYASSEPQPKLRFEMKQEALSGWASQDPMQALAYAELNPKNDLPYSRFRDVFKGAQDAPLEGRLGFLESADASKYKREMMELVYDSFSDYPREIVQWSGTLPPGELRDLALHRTIDHWARFDPLAAKAWMETVSEPHNLRANYIELGESWARVDPVAAAEWYNGLPSNEQSPRVIERIFKRWLQYEPETASTWLASQPPSQSMDSAIAHYAERLSYSNPEKAIEWASKIQGDQRRGQTIHTAARYYLNRNPGKALQYFQGNTTMPADIRQRYIDSANRRIAPTPDGG